MAQYAMTHLPTLYMLATCIGHHNHLLTVLPTNLVLFSWPACLLITTCRQNMKALRDYIAANRSSLPQLIWFEQPVQHFPSVHGYHTSKWVLTVSASLARIHGLHTHACCLWPGGQGPARQTATFGEPGEARW